MEKFLQNIQEAEKIIQVTDHMVYVTFPLIKDKKLLLKILMEIKIAITNCINSILQYEYLYKRIRLYKDSKANFRIFIEKCAPKYRITEKEIKLIQEIFDVIEKHKQSPFEFVKDEKIIILSENLTPKVITVEKTKEFLTLGKDVLRKTKEIILR
ncbi:MAG TPA: hypothetical protein VMZ91_07735 [Candidatus Paceibacterota bacterium]|nr:hypothetical protein [Candidatus Paceibacterota bacterium]